MGLRGAEFEVKDGGVEGLCAGKGVGRYMKPDWDTVSVHWADDADGDRRC